MNLPPAIVDIHTHSIDRYPTAIVNVTPAEVDAIARRYPSAVLSTGLHPWDSDTVTDSDIAMLDAAAVSPSVVAIGETGLDSLRGAPLEQQIQLLVSHISLSETHSKPLIVHLVKHLDALLAVRRETSPTQPWIIHGFRGKPAQARSLLDAGCHLSLGTHFNPLTAAYIPDDRLFAETDDSTVAIDTVIASIAAARSTTAQHLTEILKTNISTL